MHRNKRINGKFANIWYRLLSPSPFPLLLPLPRRCRLFNFHRIKSMASEHNDFRRTIITIQHSLHLIYILYNVLVQCTCFFSFAFSLSMFHFRLFSYTPNSCVPPHFCNNKPISERLSTLGTNLNVYVCFCVRWSLLRSTPSPQCFFFFSQFIQILRNFWVRRNYDELKAIEII